MEANNGVHYNKIKSERTFVIRSNKDSAENKIVANENKCKNMSREKKTERSNETYSRLPLISNFSNNSILNERHFQHSKSKYNYIVM